MLRNEEDYGPDPDAFNPERFLKDGKLNLDIREPSTMAFGFGRRFVLSLNISYGVLNFQINRECPGKALALSTLWLTTASLLCAFNITKALDENGNPIEAEIKYTSSLVWYVRLSIPFTSHTQYNYLVIRYLSSARLNPDRKRRKVSSGLLQTIRIDSKEIGHISLPQSGSLYIDLGSCYKQSGFQGALDRPRKRCELSRYRANINFNTLYNIIFASK